MAQHKLEVSELDFDKIKANLKTFLQSQTQFQDYDFDGSGLSILLDVLSYNTHYLSYIANMSTNELYLDSADIRNNIVSLAKMLGYTPSSPRAPRASINVKLNDAIGSSVTMQKGTVFGTIVDTVEYQYVTNEDITITPVDGIYEFKNVTLYEGTLVTFKYTYDVNDTDQKFVIPSNMVDTSTLKVTVQNSNTDTTQAVYSLAGGYNNVAMGVYTGSAVTGGYYNTRIYMIRRAGQPTHGAGAGSLKQRYQNGIADAKTSSGARKRMDEACPHTNAPQR